MSSKMCYGTSHKAWNYERALKRRLVAGIILLEGSECQETKKRRLKKYEASVNLRKPWDNLIDIWKLRNFTLPVFKLRNTHCPFAEVLAFLHHSLVLPRLVSCIVLQLPSHLWSPWSAVHDVNRMKQSDCSTAIMAHSCLPTLQPPNSICDLFSWKWHIQQHIISCYGWLLCSY